MTTLEPQRSGWATSVRRIAMSILTVTLPSMALLLVILELVAGLSGRVGSTPDSHYDEVNGILRADPHAVREGEFIFSPDGRDRGTWRLNEAGWNSEAEFVESSARDVPLVAVLGDSYVEGLHVRREEKMPHRLRKAVEEHAQVYDFGKSGAPLSHYLHLARYVERAYGPDVYVFLLIFNDFSDAIRELEGVPFHVRMGRPANPFHRASAFMRFDVAGSRVIEVPPTAPSRKTSRRLLRKSALVRYLVFNLKAHVSLRRLWWSPPERTANIGGRAEVSPAFARPIELVTKYSIEALREELNGKDLIIALDAPRIAIYHDAEPGPAFEWIRSLVENACAEAEITFVNLWDYFKEDFQRNGQRFEFEYDSHWNERGHLVAARAIQSAIQPLFTEAPAEAGREED